MHCSWLVKAPLLGSNAGYCKHQVMHAGKQAKSQVAGVEKHYISNQAASIKQHLVSPQEPPFSVSTMLGSTCTHVHAPYVQGGDTLQ